MCDDVFDGVGGVWLHCMIFWRHVVEERPGLSRALAVKIAAAHDYTTLLQHKSPFVICYETFDFVMSPERVTRSTGIPTLVSVDPKRPTSSETFSAICHLPALMLSLPLLLGTYTARNAGALLLLVVIGNQPFKSSPCLYRKPPSPNTLTYTTASTNMASWSAAALVMPSLLLAKRFRMTHKVPIPAI